MRHQQSAVLHLRLTFCVLCANGAHGHHIRSHRSTFEEKGAIHCGAFRERNVPKVSSVCFYLIIEVWMRHDSLSINLNSSEKNTKDVRASSQFHSCATNFLILYEVVQNVSSCALNRERKNKKETRNLHSMLNGVAIQAENSQSIKNYFHP